MNVARMKRRAEEAIAGGEAPSYVLEQVARDALALLAERERLAEEHDGILNAPDVDSEPQMVVGKVLRVEFTRPIRGPVEVKTHTIFMWSEAAAKTAITRGRDMKTVTLVLDAPSAVRAVYAAKERLDALLAALRSVDERELPEHVAAALRAVNGTAPIPKQVFRCHIGCGREVAEEGWWCGSASCHRAPADTPATQPARDPHVSGR